MKTLIAGAATWLATLALAQTAAAASGVTLAPTTGHPSIAVAVSGAGFGASEAVDVYVDTVDTALLVSSSTGTVVGSVTVPASAQPGSHYITAIGRKSGDAAQSAFKVTTPWTAFGFGVADRRWNPFENTLSTGDVAQLGELWRAGSGGLGATPTVFNGRVYVSTTAGVQARSIVNGALQWTGLSTRNFYASPVISGLTVYLADDLSTLYALNSANGATRWSQALDSGVLSSAAVANGVAYVATSHGTVYAFKAASGASLWSFSTGSTEIDATPVVVDDTLYVGSQNNTFYALNATTGALEWSYATGGEVESSATVLGGIVYVGSDDGNLYALNAASGSLVWKTTLNGDVYQGPAVADGKVFIGTGQTFYALDQGSGQQLWSVPLANIPSSAVVANQVIYLTTRDGLLHMLDEYGDVVANVGLGGYAFLGSAAVSDGVVYVNTYAGPTYALGLKAQSQGRPGGPPVPSSLHPDFNLRPSR